MVPSLICYLFSESAFLLLHLIHLSSHFLQLLQLLFDLLSSLLVKLVEISSLEYHWQMLRFLYIIASLTLFRSAMWKIAFCNRLFCLIVTVLAVETTVAVEPANMEGPKILMMAAAVLIIPFLG